MTVRFAQLLAAYPRLAIAGGPRVGKTELAKHVTDRRVFASDDLIQTVPWPDVPARIIAELGGEPAFVLEGVQAGRCLRKGLVVDAVVLLTEPKVERTAGQVAMAKGCDRIFAEWRAAHPDVPLYVERPAEPGDTELTFDGPPLPEPRIDSNAMIVFRYDSFGLLDSERVERTQLGGIRAPARLTRTGVLEYVLPDGTKRREYRPPEEVFSEASIKTLIDAPITHLHPPEGRVDADTRAKLTIGHVWPDVHPEDDKFVAGTVCVQDAAAVQGIDNRDLCEFSPGYQARIDPTPGTSPEGESYDVVQRDIEYNHVALLPRGHGRSGPEVSLRLDSAGHQITPGQDQPTEKKTTMELTPEELAGLKALAAAAPKLLALAEASAASAAPGTPAPVAVVKTDETPAPKPETPAAPAAAATEAKPEEKNDAKPVGLTPEQQERLVNDSIELRDKARSVLGKDYSFAGKSNRQVMCDVITHVDSKYAVVGKSDDAIAAVFDVSLSRHAERADSVSQLGELRGATRTDSADQPVDEVNGYLAKGIEAAGRKSA